MTIVDLKKKIIHEIKVIHPSLPKDFVFDLGLTPDNKMGDFTVPCFKLAKFLDQSPLVTATNLANRLQGKKLFERVDASGPYLNFFLKKEILFQTVIGEILFFKNDFGAQPAKKEKVLIEYSGANTNKPQHLGHLRNNFLGIAVSNLLATYGCQVKSVNLINDRGIHIAKSMVAYQKWGNGKTPETEGIKGDAFVGNFYVLFSKKAEENQDLLVEAQNMLRKWEAGDEATLKLWRQMTDWALQGHRETYQKIGARFDHWYYESEFYKRGKQIILAALKRGACQKRDDGAIVIDLKPYGLEEKVLIRHDGTSVYLTQDIALAYLKQKEFKPNKSIYVVASEQDAYLKSLFKILELFGYIWAKNLCHLSYGMIALPEGRMKSREGKVVEADDLISEMERLAKEAVLARNKDLTPSDLAERARIIAQAALKFFFLKIGPKQNTTFYPDQSIVFEGDTGPYLLYTYARIKSLIDKDENIKNSFQAGNFDFSILVEPLEREIAARLSIFSEIIKQAAFDYNPSLLVEYLLKLSQKFNEFYHAYPVLKAENKLVLSRLALAQAVSQVVKNGLTILGIETLDRM